VSDLTGSHGLPLIWTVTDNLAHVHPQGGTWPLTCMHFYPGEANGLQTRQDYNSLVSLFHSVT